MGKKVSLIHLFMATMMLLCTSVGAPAALLDVGPVVTQVNPSTEPNLGHGFPLWYRDTNRVPLELCLDRLSGMCLTAEPNPGAPLNFPNNLGDELFWWVGDADITTIPGGGKALLVQAIEAAYSTGSVFPGAQVSFARIRIRIDNLPQAGEYVVTTPFKQFTFNVAADALEINHTEDIGIAEGLNFSGALKGSVGPFLYCSNPAQRPAGFVGNPNVGCEALGSTFTPPGNPPNGLSFPANYFRIQGPGGFDHFTNLFRIMGKLHTGSIPTPLDVPKSSYARGPNGMQVNVFATTQALSNQVNPAAPFPANYALTGAPSVLVATATDIPDLPMNTNSPADGAFFKASGIFAAPGSVPATINVTNSADTPITVKTIPLVDEVVVNNALFSPQNGNLSIKATSMDKVAVPTLQAFMPGMTAPLGTLVNGNLIVTFPFTDNAAVPPKTHNIPPTTITVKSALGGEATAAVSTFLPVAAPATGVNITAVPSGLQSSGESVTFTATTVGGDAIPYEFRYFWRSSSGTWTEGRTYGSASWSWDTTGLPAGVYFIQVYARQVGTNGEPDVTNSISYNLFGPLGSISINGGAEYTNSRAAVLTLSATDFGGADFMQFSKDGGNTWITGWEPFATTRNISSLDPAGDGVKTMSVRYRNAAQVISQVYTDTIIYETVPPTGTIQIDSGAATTSSPTVTLTLSATDNLSGVTHMQFSKDGGVTWVSAWEPYATTRVVTLTPVSGLKTIDVRFRDAAGNVSDSYQATITKLPLPGSIQINSDVVYTNTRAVVLTLNAATDFGVADFMQFSKDGGSTWITGWEPYATTRNISSLDPVGDGVKTMSVRFKTAAEVISPVYTDSIILETVPPTGTIQIDGGAATTTSFAVTLTLSATDDLSGVTHMQFSKDGGVTWVTAWEPYATTRSVTLTAGNGPKTMDVRFKDAAGNISGSFQDTITKQ